MARTIRFTFRLSAKEFGAMTEVARHKHALPKGSDSQGCKRLWLEGRNFYAVGAQYSGLNF